MNKKNDINDSGFKVPDHYFDGIEDAVFNKLRAEAKLDDIAEPGFNTPDHYFATIEDKVEKRLHHEPKVISLFSRKRLMYAASIAAAAVLAFVVFFNKEETIIEDLDPQLVESYILDQDLSTYELASLLSEEDLAELDMDVLDETFTDESLETYLLENVDIETIIEQ